MKITKRQLRRIIQEELTFLVETRPTFGLRSVDYVRHEDWPELGLGRVVAKMDKRDQVVLVKWETAKAPQRHMAYSLIKDDLRINEDH